MFPQYCPQYTPGGRGITCRKPKRSVHRALKKDLQNLVWATGYNTFAIPLAAGILIGYGILLTMAMGAVLMSASTVIISVNACFLTA
jgi:cation transport ATPase